MALKGEAYNCTKMGGDSLDITDRGFEENLQERSIVLSEIFPHLNRTLDA